MKSLYILLFPVLLLLLFYLFFFPRYFSSWWILSLFLLYTPISLCLSGNLLYFFIYISLVSVATIYLPVLFFFDFPYCGCNLFLPHLILVFYCVPLFVTFTLFADDTQVIFIYIRGRILVHVTIYRKFLIGRDGHLDQSEAYDIS